jgi:hypothetical protein
VFASVRTKELEAQFVNRYGWHPYEVEVVFDGTLIQNVVEADEGFGYVLLANPDHISGDQTHLVYQRRYGRVELRRRNT